MPEDGNGRRRVPMMDGSDHSRHALARRGSEMGRQGPQGWLKLCPINSIGHRPIELDVVF